MAIPDNYIDKITKGNDSRMISPAADMVRVDNDNFDGETLDEVLDQLTQQLGQKANDADVVKGIKDSNGNTLQKNNGIVTLPESQGGLTKEDISVETQGDGTVKINVGRGADKDTYAINLNHTHEGMVKLEKFVESNPPASMTDDKIYVQVDDLQSPGEIQKLYLFGLAFEGGGGVIDETPRLTSPAANTEIDFLGQSSTTLRVKGLYLGSQLTITKTGDLTITANGSAVSTISATDANNGIELTIAKGANFSNDNCSLEFNSSEVTRTVVVKDSTMLPGGLYENKAWATATDKQSPVDATGFCITPFLQATRAQVDGAFKTYLTIKSGTTIATSGYSWIGYAHADSSTPTQSKAAFRYDVDPKTRKTGAGDGLYVSATFKMSEIANCYIYDHNAGQYLWAGENIDQTVPPTI